MILDYNILEHHKINKITLVPQNYLHMIKEDDMHLALACYINREGYEKYTDFYTGGENGRKKDSYLILDNGVIEGDPISFPGCIEIAKQINADEIVLPDVYRDAAATEKAIEEAVQYIDSLSEFEKYKFSYMMVPQGKTLQEWLQCAQKLMEKYANDTFIEVIGIPRHLQRNECDALARLYAITEIYNKMDSFIDRYKFHFLGTGLTAEELYEYDIEQFKRYMIPIRSVDSASAYVFAKEGIPYTADVLRPNFDPIDFKSGECDENLLGINIFNWRNMPPH